MNHCRSKMTTHTLFIAPDSSCVIHGKKLNFEYNVSEDIKHYYITDSGKLLVAKVLNTLPLVHISVEENNIFSVMNGVIDSYKGKLFNELLENGHLGLFQTFEPIIADMPIQFHFNYENEIVTAFQAEKVHYSDGVTFYKSAQKGWYIDQNISKPFLYIETETAKFDEKIWYEHLPETLQQNMQLNDLSSLYDFPFPKPIGMTYPTIPTAEEMLLPEYEDCKEFIIHNNQVDLKLFGKQILLINNGKWDCLNIIYTPKTKEFHVLSDTKDHMVAHSLAESIFHSKQDPYGKLFYEYYMESNCEYALTLDNKPVLKTEVNEDFAIRFGGLFNFQSSLLGDERNLEERKKLPVIFGDYKKDFVGFYDHRYYGSDETYIRHNAIFKNENHQYILIRFSEYQVDHYDCEQYDFDKYGIFTVGMTKLLPFNNADDLLTFLFAKSANQNDLRLPLKFMLESHGIKLPKKPTMIFK